MSEQFTAYFVNGPMQGERHAYPGAPMDRILVHLPQRAYARADSDPLGPELRIGVYTFFCKAPNSHVFNYLWKGISNMDISREIDYLTGRPPHTLKFVHDSDEVIIDAGTLERLIGVARRGAPPVRSDFQIARGLSDAAILEVAVARNLAVNTDAAVSIWVDDQIVVRSLGDGSTERGVEANVDVPIRRAGKPHKMLVRLSR